jgi:hypothetical protein
MIPTIQVVYGSMPEIKHYSNVLTSKKDSLVYLKYDSEFYLFKNADKLDTFNKIFNFLDEQFNCKNKNNRQITYYFFTKTLYLKNIDSSEVINKLITDNFYDSFQIMLNNNFEMKSLNLD